LAVTCQKVQFVGEGVHCYFLIYRPEFNACQFSASWFFPFVLFYVFLHAGSIADTWSCKQE